MLKHGITTDCWPKLGHRQFRPGGDVVALDIILGDNDFEGFKARVIHKVLTPSGSRETNHLGTASSTTTAGFNHPATAMGAKRRR